MEAQIVGPYRVPDDQEHVAGISGRRYGKWLAARYSAQARPPERTSMIATKAPDESGTRAAHQPEEGSQAAGGPTGPIGRQAPRTTVATTRAPTAAARTSRNPTNDMKAPRPVPEETRAAA